MNAIRLKGVVYHDVSASHYDLLCRIMREQSLSEADIDACMDAKELEFGCVSREGDGFVFSLDKTRTTVYEKFEKVFEFRRSG